MTLLSAKYIAALYSAFRLMPPFDRYDLPTASKIEWKIINDPTAYGYFHCDPHLKIEISKGRCLHFSTVSETLLHEMCHLTLYNKGYKHWDAHGATFYKLADKVSNLYGFDPKRL